MPPVGNAPLSPRRTLEGRSLARRYAAMVAEQLGDPPAYDAIADWYADYVTGAAAAFTARAGEALRRVLGRGHGVCWDVACGTCVYADRIRQLGWIPIGTDISIAQLRRAATQMPVAVADATRLVVQPGSVAAVASVLCHTDVDDYAAVCRAAATALVAGGRFAHVGVHPCFCGAFVDRSNSEHLITTPGYWRSAVRRLVTHRRAGAGRRTHLPLSDLIAAVTGAGLVLDMVIEAGEPTPDVLAIRAHKPGR
jgi:SAM-dependent methyltransferase